MYYHATKMNRSRIFWPSIINIKANMSTNTNSKNHYETLELKKSATHNEIKSAYYKLTMQYHPDKNKSDAAKEKFRDVAEAYEILGNQNSRKNYDRKVTVRNTGLSPRKGPIIVKPPSTNVYKTRMASSSDPIGMNDTAYNYEEWARAHYTASFRRRQQANARLRNMIEEENDHKSTIILSGVAIFGFMVILLFCAQTTNYYDVPMDLSKTKPSAGNREQENSESIGCDKVTVK